MSILASVMSVSLLSTILAVLVVVADRFFNNYGECEIDINNGTRKLKVNGGLTLLAALASQGIFIPSACGGRATCGLCKVRLAGEAGVVLPTEEPYLSDDEKAKGVRLSCQVKVKQDMQIHVPEELFLAKEYRARVERITQLTYDIKEFRLALLEPEEIEFKAGQYVQVQTRPYDSVRESVSRAYSIASVPSDRHGIELIIRLVPGGVCTTFMHQHVKEGDTITLHGPFGDFYLREGADELLLIAGGSGLAPVKSIIFDVLEKGLDKKMTLFFGAVTRKDLYYVELFSQLAAEHENFEYVPALSAPEPGDDWEGETGLITEVVKRHVRDAHNKQAYLCGSPGMINACLKVLGEIGFTEDRIFYDKF